MFKKEVTKGSDLSGPRVWLALVLGLWGGACGANGTPDARVPDAAVQDAFTLPGFWDGGAAPVCGMATRPLVVNGKPVDMLVLFDRSGSMSRAFGNSTRYEVARQLLDEVLLAYEGRIRFGFQQFPARGGCNGLNFAQCCTDPPSVPVGLMSARAISSAIAAAGPVDGNTPTAEALRLAGLFYAGLNDGVEERYVLLSTDGQPSCLTDGSLAKDVIRSGKRIAGPCLDALAQVKALAALKVKVIVLGIGADLSVAEQGAPSCLEDLAIAGGAARPVSPSFFSITNPKEFEQALQRIFGAVTLPSCSMSINSMAPDPNNVSVYLDKQQIPFDPKQKEGWDWLPGQRGFGLEIYGVFCSRLERLQAERVDIFYGCPPCDTPGSCQ